MYFLHAQDSAVDAPGYLAFPGGSSPHGDSESQTHMGSEGITFSILFFVFLPPSHGPSFPDKWTGKDRVEDDTSI